MSSVELGQILKKDKHFMNLAFTVSEGSKCVRAQYGSVVLGMDGHVVSTGCNGKPAGCANDHICYREGLPPNAPKENCCLHSEVNALMFCSPEERRGGTIYVCGIPCNDCALVIMQSGLARIVYYDGASKSGHRGCSDDGYWEKYGKAGITRVAYTEEAWNALYKE